jgi:hypothetical protein
MQKGFYVFVTLFLLLSVLAKSQNIPGYNVSNYAGISGFDLQPASIADNRYKFDAVLMGGGFTVANNFVSLRRDGITKGRLWKDTINDIKDVYFSEEGGDNRKGAAVSAYLQAASFMWSFNQNFSVALTFQVRSQTNVDNVHPELATMIYNDFNIPDLWRIKLKNDQFSITSMTWAEYGIGFGQVIQNRGDHFWKVGGRLKIIQGIGAAYLYARNLTYSWDSKDTLSLFQSEFGYGHSDNFELNDNGLKLNRYVTNPSLGMDIGVVYEYRPAVTNPFGLDEQPKPQRRDQNKYKYRLGISLIDVGRLKFKKGNYSNDFKADVRYWDVKNVDLAKTPVQSLDDTIRRRFQVEDGESTFNMPLPTALSVQLDYHIYNDFYLNMTTYISPRFLGIETKVHGLDYEAVAPRWDHKWFGVFLPLSVNSFGQFNTGLTLRAGPLIIGSADVSSLLFRKNVQSADIHAALKIPIPYGKPGTRIKDECPDACPAPGSSNFMREVNSFWKKFKNIFRSKKEKSPARSL